MGFIGARNQTRIARAAPLAASVLALSLAAMISPGQQGKDAVLQARFEKQVVPIITEHCLQCHSGEGATAGFRLDAGVTPALVRSRAAQWKKLKGYVETGHMPPDGRPRLTAAQERTLSEWIDAVLDNGRKPGDPGRVTVRRLNRSEYNNTIRDLLYLKATPADEFPSDDVGYGFDNIGDVLTISPLLMEKYIAAAEKLAEQAIVLPLYKESRFEASEFGQIQGTNIDGNGDRNFFTNAFMGASYSFPVGGDFALRVKAYGQQAGPEVCKVLFRLDGKPVQVVEVAATRTNPGIYQVPVQVTSGPHKIEVGFINDYYRPDAADPAQRDRNLIVQYLEVVGPFGSAAAKPESHTRIVSVYPGQLEHKSAARKVISDFAARAFRRPVTQGELDRLTAIYQMVRDKGDPYERGIQVAVTAVLASPSFLFRGELDARPGSGDSEPLGDYAVASRLSYFLWSSMPDDELFDLALRGRLQDSKVLEQQVDRMLKDPKASALTDDFAAQWLNLRLLETLNPDPSVFEGWSDQIKADMVAETKAYFANVVAEDRPITDFLDSDYTFLNGRLARFYGIEGANGERFVRTRLTDRRRGGLVTQGSMLTVTSNPNRTSPVKRGKWILDNLLGGTPPPPPPDVGVIEDDPAAMEESSLRTKMERHRRDPNCASCHNQMDPLGFALDNFDGVGRWRTKDGKWDIDDSGVLPDGTKFRGAEGLKKILVARKDDFAGVLATKLLTYATGRGIDAADAPTVERIRQRAVRNGYRFSELVKGVVLSDAFRKRLADTKATQ